MNLFKHSLWKSWIVLSMIKDKRNKIIFKKIIRVSISTFLKNKDSNDPTFLLTFVEYLFINYSYLIYLKIFQTWFTQKQNFEWKHFILYFRFFFSRRIFYYCFFFFITSHILYIYIYIDWKKKMVKKIFFLNFKKL